MAGLDTDTQIYANTLTTMETTSKKRPFRLGYILENRWTVLTIIISLLILWMIGRNFVHAVTIRYDIAMLRGEKKSYQEVITADSTLLEELKNDASLERYARETFYMHDDDEEIFIIK